MQVFVFKRLGVYP